MRVCYIPVNAFQIAISMHFCLSMRCYCSCIHSLNTDDFGPFGALSCRLLAVHPDTVYHLNGKWLYLYSAFIQNALQLGPFATWTGGGDQTANPVIRG